MGFFYNSFSFLNAPDISFPIDKIATENGCTTCYSCGRIARKSTVYMRKSEQPYGAFDGVFRNLSKFVYCLIEWQ